jgi:hypothetical protein
MQRTLAVLMLPILTGCFPAYVTKQPALEFEVVDAAGRPVEAAQIHFVRYSTHPFHGARSYWLSQFQTDRTGRAKVEREFEFQLVIIAPDGGGLHEYEWAWCATKDTYASASAIGIGHSPDPRLVQVTLQSKTVPAACKWVPNYHSGTFVTNAP